MHHLSRDGSKIFSMFKEKLERSGGVFFDQLETSSE